MRLSYDSLKNQRNEIENKNKVNVTLKNVLFFYYSIHNLLIFLFGSSLIFYIHSYTKFTL
jgi:hypothetical protein